MLHENNTLLRRCRVVAVTLALMTIAAAGVAVAEEEVDRRLDAAADGRVVIENLAGEVTVTGWSRNEVHVTGTLEDQVKEFIFEKSGNRIKIRVVYPKHVEDTTGSFLQVSLPAGSRVDIKTVSAEIEIEGVTGRIDAQSVSGDVTATGAPAEINAETVSGTVELEVECDKVYAQTVSGDVELEGVSGEIEAQTVSGEITVEGGDVRRFSGNTVSGDIEFDAALVGDGTFSFNAHSGDIVLSLPDDVSAEFEVNTFSGDIDNDFGPDGQRKDKYGPGSELEFTTGNGDARVRINTFSGDVELQRR